MSTFSSSPAAGEVVGSTRSRVHPAWVLLGGLTVVFHLGLIFYGLTPALVSRGSCQGICRL
ncbi:hypothetical protein DU490_13170 [Halomonas sp. DQ26W]|nr:hypothetical protein DU490_16090 [Halomonas sp. DQ26W]RDB42366.1 hypothetical protein DU490_13170 [Halomonas sp. DQ26W]